MKKKYIIICLLIIIIVSFVLFICLKNNNSKELSGEIIDTAIYKYKLPKPDDYEFSYSYITFYNDEFYYLYLGNETYLYKIDLYNSKTKLIGKLDNKYRDCSINDSFIKCGIVNDKEELSVFDFNLKLINSKDNSNNEYTFYIDKEYSLKTVNNIVYLNDKEIYESSENQYITDAKIIDDNVYLLIQKYDVGGYFIYDVTNKKMSEYNYGNIEYFTNGYIFYDTKGKEIANFKTNNNIKHDYSDNNFLLSFYNENCNEDSKYSIMYNEANILINNNEDNSFITYDFKDKIKNISSTKYINNRIYILSEDEYYNYYVILIDVDNLDSEWNSFETYKEKIAKENEKLVKEIKDDYNVDVFIKDKVNIKFPDMTVKISTDDYENNLALKQIKDNLSQFDKEVFNIFYEDDMKGLAIYLTDTLTPTVDYSVTNPSAYSYTYYQRYTINLDISNLDINSTFIHELMHSFEHYIDFTDVFGFEDWNSYNGGHSYLDSYDDDYTSHSENTIVGETDENEIYFVSSYSKTYTTEDKATLFEEICSKKPMYDYKNFPNLVKKAKYLKSELIKHIPKLENTKCLIDIDN